MHARPRAHLDDVVRRPDGVLVVLHDDDGIADVAQALERRDHLDVVFGMQPDARLVEHVQHSHEARADLRRQPDPLRFAAGERPRAAIEVEIVESDAQQQFQPPRISLSTCRPASAPRPVGLTVPRNACSSSKLSWPTSWIVLPAMVKHSLVARTRAPLQSGQVCSTITLSSQASMPEFASPLWR